MQQTNKTFEVHGYEDTTARTEINFNDEIVFQQIDIADVKVLYRHGIIYIEGYIRHQDQINSENIFKLNQWSRERGDSNKWLKKTNIKIVRGDYVIRHLIFNAFIVDYMEYFNKGKHRFKLILRQYKLARLDGTRGETGAVKTESYVKSETIKGVDGTLIITPIDTMSTINSALNLVSSFGLIEMATTKNPIGLKIYFIAHATGLISEFIADVYFTVTGRPEKLGDFNLTRDHFYKPIGEIIKSTIDYVAPTIKTSATLGEDIYDIGNITFAIFELRKKVLNYVANFKENKGLDFTYKLVVKNVEVSRFGRQVQVEKYTGLTPIATATKITTDLGLDSYLLNSSIKAELKEQKGKVWFKNLEKPKINKE